MKQRERFAIVALFVISATLCVSVAATGLVLLAPAASSSASKATPLHEFEEHSADAQLLVDGVTPPRIVERKQPEYPAELREARVEGKVILQAVIDTDGRVSAIDVLRTSKQIAMDNAAIDAVRQWRYEPARKDGEPVKVLFTVVVNFDLAGAA